MIPAQAVQEEVEGSLLLWGEERGGDTGGEEGGGDELGCDDDDDADVCIAPLPPACCSRLLASSPLELLGVGSIILAMQ